MCFDIAELGHGGCAVLLSGCEDVIRALIVRASPAPVQQQRRKAPRPWERGSALQKIHKTVSHSSGEDADAEASLDFG